MRDLLLVGLTASSFTASALGANCEWLYRPALLTLPQAQGWHFNGTAQANATASSGVLVYGPASQGGTTFWDADIPAGAMDFTKFDWSIETEVRLTGATHGNVSGLRRGGFVLILSDKAGRWIVADIGSTRLGLRNDNAGTSDPQANVTLNDAFHTIKLTAGPTGARLFVDGTLVVDLPLGTGLTPNRANFGDGSTLGSATLTEIRRVDLIPAQEPCPGDINCDTFVADLDFETFVYGYNLLDCADPAMTPKCPADLNGDKVVDDVDFTIFVGMYNQLLCFPD